MASLLGTASSAARAPMTLFQLPPAIRCSIYPTITTTLPRRAFSLFPSSTSPSLQSPAYHEPTSKDNAASTPSELAPEFATSSPAAQAATEVAPSTASELSTSAAEAAPATADAATNSALSLVDIALAGPTALLDAVHAIGLPWWAALPTTALLVRFAIVYPWTTVPGRRRTAIAHQLAPFVASSAKEKAQSDTDRYDRTLDWRQHPDHDARLKRHYQLRFFIHFWRENRRVKKLLGLPLIHWTTLANPIIFLSFGEAVRVKTGGSRGTLSVLFSPFQAAMDKLLPNSSKQPEQVLGPDGMPAARLEAAQEATIRTNWDDKGAVGDGLSSAQQQIGGELYQIKSLATQTHEQLRAFMAYQDPTMLTEGLAWFQNLTLPDSTLILPCLFGASMLVGSLNLNLWKKPEDKRKGSPEQIVPQDTKPSATSASTSQSHTTAKTADAQIMNEVNVAFARADEMRELADKHDKDRDPFLRLTVPQRLQILVAGFFFLVATKFSAGVLLYALPYVLSGRLMSRWIAVRYPLPPQLSACKRPMRMKIRKQYRDASLGGH